MPESMKTLALVDNLIEQARKRRGIEIIPKNVEANTALATIRAIQSQRADLTESGSEIELRELVRLICEARIFSLDGRENDILQYAYQVIAMNYLGHFGRERQSEDRYVRQSFDALVRQTDGREGQQ